MSGPNQPSSPYHAVVRNRSDSQKRLRTNPVESTQPKKLCTRPDGQENAGAVSFDLSRSATSDPLSERRGRDDGLKRRMTISSSYPNFNAFQVNTPTKCVPKSPQTKTPPLEIYKVEPFQTLKSQSFHGVDSSFFGPRPASPTTLAVNKLSMLSLNNDDALFEPQQGRSLKLPTMTTHPHDGINCITVDTFSDLMHGRLDTKFKRIRIFDCRYDYEYNAGHIINAENFPVLEPLVEAMKKEIQTTPIEEGGDVCIIIHCEFSSHRGPLAYRRIRDLDRKENHWRHPSLTFPEMYLLNGGYKALFHHDLKLCFPQAYLEMRDPNYTKELKVATQKAKGTKPGLSKNKGLSRSCSNIHFDRPLFDNDEVELD